MCLEEQRAACGFAVRSFSSSPIRKPSRRLTAMPSEFPTLTRNHIRLEPLGLQHLDGLLAAATADPSLYRWTVVPQTRQAMQTYVETAMALRDAGTGLAFATIRIDDGAVIGSTRYFDMERWIWPAGHARHANPHPDVCEIGYTWLTRSVIRTAANTEAKLMMLTQAFESWQMVRVCLHTDARNEQSRAAMERIGCKFEGILRSHRMSSDFIPRDSARYSIVAAEWPDAKCRLTEMAAPR
jgi:RimJ/RimL family protein N-acetyltransferase